MNTQPKPTTGRYARNLAKRQVKSAARKAGIVSPNTKRKYARNNSINGTVIRHEAAADQAA